MICNWKLAWTLVIYIYMCVCVCVCIYACIMSMNDMQLEACMGPGKLMYVCAYLFVCIDEKYLHMYDMHSALRTYIHIYIHTYSYTHSICYASLSR